MKRHLPNLLTCLNLFFGCLALVALLRYHPSQALYLVVAAAVCDVLDGAVARALNVSSPIGKQLDSLADMVSFGLVPAFVLFRLLQVTGPATFAPEVFRILQFIPFSVAVFSALRLAKFNIDERQTTGFIGLPTPANTLWIIPLPLLAEEGSWWMNPWVLIGLSMLSSYLLVSEWRLFSFKVHGFSIRKNLFQYILILSSLVLALIFSWSALPMMVGLYVLLSLIKSTVETTSNA